MKRISVILIFFIWVACSTSKDAGLNESALSKTIENRRFVFVARTVLPAGGRVIQLTSTYDVRVTGDSLVSFLPYFGRAYSAPIGNSNPGFQFTSTNFDYQKEDKKRGGWQITIVPRDQQDIQRMFLSVSTGGSASLQVVSNTRQAISYNGHIEKTKK